VATPDNISLAIYDLAGQYSIVWNAIDSNGESVSSGMYIYKLRASNVVLTKKLILLR
jgi:hypothetical protein